MHASLLVRGGCCWVPVLVIEAGKKAGWERSAILVGRCRCLACFRRGADSHVRMRMSAKVDEGPSFFMLGALFSTGKCMDDGDATYVHDGS
jgi:hypothetical protein